MKLRKMYHVVCLSTLFILLSLSLSAANLYWIGGPGNWSNTANWSLTSGGAPGTVLPNSTTNVVFDLNSGLSNGNNVNIPEGHHYVEDFIVTGTAANFKLRFTGGATNATKMNVYGDLRLLTTHSIVYEGIGSHKWIFHGKNFGSQEIKSSGKNLHHVEFPNNYKDYHLLGDLFASDQITYQGGNLTTNNFNITTEYFAVYNNGAAVFSPKSFIAGTSTINCDHYYAKLTYGALNITGNYIIKAKQFEGAASSIFSDTTSHPKIILKDFDPSISLFYNSFECTDCKIDTIIVENTFETRFAGNFTIEHVLEIQNTETVISFNGFNLTPAIDVTINGNVITPTAAGCDDRTIFQVISDDYITLNRSSGSLKINDAILKNIKTQGGASFVADNSMLLETSSGWTLTNSPTPQTYHWIGNSGVDTDWDNPDNWELSNGTTNGCTPIAVDDVVVNNSAVNGIRIPPGILAACNDFTWIKSSPAALLLDGTLVDEASLYIKGDLLLLSSAVVNTVESHAIIFDAAQISEITTNGVILPQLRFTGYNGKWKLNDNLECDRLHLYSGGLTTSNFDIETNALLLFGNQPKALTLGSSHITVNGPLDLAPIGVFDGIIVNAGTSFIECEELDFRTVTLYDVQLNNDDDDIIGLTQTSNFPDDLLTANQLILNGTGLVTSKADLNVNSLVFKQDDAILLIEPGETMTINETIISETTSANPASIKSNISGTQAQVEKTIGNLCITGHVNFQDIDADMDGVFHAPLGSNGGNNTNIDFTNSSILTPLYWIGNTGDWDIKPNWSNLSGGCPVNKDPNSAFRLIFDDNSFTSAADIITLPILTNCKTLEFNNTFHPANFDIQTRLNPFQVIINNGIVNFSGAKMFVQVKTVVNLGGSLTLDITEGDTPKYDTPILELHDNATLEVKSNTLLKVRE